MRSQSGQSHLATSERHVAITGAGGWIGMVALELLEKLLGPDAWMRVHAFGASARTLTLSSGTRVDQRPLYEMKSLRAPELWVLHTAFLTKGRAREMSESAYCAANRAISGKVLEALETIPVTGVFVASSGAAYRAGDPIASSDMRLYGRLKLEDEARFADWGDRRACRTIICRIFNVTGPHVNKHKDYAIASMIIDALEKRPVQVKAPREVWRAYVAIEELLLLIMSMLASTGAVEKFDSGGEPMELAALAAAIVETLGGGPVTRASIIEPVPDLYFGNGRAYAERLRQFGIEPTPLSEQIQTTANYLAGLRSRRVH